MNAMLLVLCFSDSVTLQDAPKPATVKQIKDAIDWSKVPNLTGATKVTSYFSQHSYVAPGTFAQAAQFYREQLPKLGWMEDTSIPDEGQKEYLSVNFEKNGMRLGVSGYRSKPDDPMTITLSIGGNVDARQWPRLDDAQVKTSYKTGVVYLTKKSPEEFTAFCRKFMKEQGWTEQKEDGAETWAKEGRHVLSFNQNAIKATLVAAKEKDGGYLVSYVSYVQSELSAEDAREVMGQAQAKPATLAEARQVIDISKLPRMEKAAKRQRDEKLLALPIGTSYEIPDAAGEVVKFYRQLLKDQGCTELPAIMESDTNAILYFEKAGFLLGLNVSHEKKEGKTSVSLINYGNVDLVKLPAPPGAKLLPMRMEHVNLDTTLTVAEAFAFYRKELVKLGWKEASSNEYSVKFTQNAIELDIEIQVDTNKKTSVGLGTRMR